jgi:hypothetical protein
MHKHGLVLLTFRHCWRAGIDVDTFLMDLDSVLELLNAVEVRRSGSREVIRQYDQADYAMLIETACRIFLVATAKVSPRLLLYDMFVPRCLCLWMIRMRSMVSGGNFQSICVTCSFKHETVSFSCPP